MQDKLEILNIKIDNLSPQEILRKCDDFLLSGNQHYITTVNPEFIVAAKTDEEFKKILNFSDLAVADGVGLVYAAKLFGEKLKRNTGVDLMINLCEFAEQKNCSVYFLGGEETIAAQAAELLKNNFPKLIISGAESGGEIINPKDDDEELLTRINDNKPDIIFVALGQIKQEKWIYYHLDKMPSVKIAVGVGGSFDYISGQISRAPLFMRKAGLEWLYRLILQPSRIRRIINATVIFPWLILKDYFKPRS